MKRLRVEGEGKNVISARLIELRKSHEYSQRDLADKLQLDDFDVDKNMITRIETGKRFVSDFEVRALAEFFGVSYSYLLDGVATNEDLEKYQDL